MMMFFGYKSQKYLFEGQKGGADSARNVQGVLKNIKEIQDEKHTDLHPVINDEIVFGLC